MIYIYIILSFIKLNINKYCSQLELELNGLRELALPDENYYLRNDSNINSAE